MQIFVIEVVFGLQIIVVSQWFFKFMSEKGKNIMGKLLPGRFAL